MTAIADGHMEIIQTGRSGIKRYKMEHLLKCFTMSLSLRRQDLLRGTLVQALWIILPKPWAKYYVAKIEESIHVPLPSQPTLSQFTFILDIAIMRSRRATMKLIAKAIAGGEPAPVIYIYSDSSPQGGTNWLISSYDYIEGKDIDYAGEVAWDLMEMGCKRRRQALGQEDDYPSDDKAWLEEEIDLLQNLMKLVRHRHFIPVGSKPPKIGMMIH